ncbi:MAG: hypothetical protein NT149_04320 [Candidatus Gottesmanbacteria bacterium]|nr:hypothetical protein [Candidatus Gottesmanbacteria bacterium]
MTLLEAAMRADRSEKEGYKIRLGRELTDEEIETKRVAALQNRRGETIGAAARGVLRYRPTSALPPKR